MFWTSIDTGWPPGNPPLPDKNEKIEQYFHVVVFTMLYKVVLTGKSVDKTLVCDHSNESYSVCLCVSSY